MQRLGHGTEIGLESPRKRSGNSYGITCLIGVEPRKPTCSPHSTEDTDHCGRMPSMVIVRKRDCAGDLTFHFQSNDVCGKGVHCGEVLTFTQRPNSGKNR